MLGEKRVALTGTPICKEIFCDDNQTSQEQASKIKKGQGSFGGGQHKGTRSVVKLWERKDVAGGESPEWGFWGRQGERAERLGGETAAAAARCGLARLLAPPPGYLRSRAS